MRKIEAFAIVLIILTFGAWAIELGIPVFMAVAPEQVSVEHISRINTWGMLARMVPPLVLNFLIAMWLFLVGRKRTSAPWVWAFLGISFGFPAVILFYGVDVWKKLGDGKGDGKGDITDL